MKLPTVTVVIPTYNSSGTLARCLGSIRAQSYPQRLVDIILVDGGSRDNTKEIAVPFGVTWLKVDPKKQNVEFNKSTGLAHAKGELVFFVDHDNILPDTDILAKMVEPFLREKEMVGVETLRYHYDPTATLLDRYFALFGINDPLAFYIGKADRLSFIYDRLPGRFHAVDKGKYFLVRFTPAFVPTIGANGFLVRRKTLLEHADSAPGNYYPIDVNVDLIRNGFTTYAFVPGAILHLSGSGDVWYYLKRRMMFMRQYHLGEGTVGMQQGRRFSLYQRGDFWKLAWFVFISLTIVIPLIDSIRGYRKIHDPAWFINPLLCFCLVILYGFVIIEHQLNTIGNYLSEPA
jgi:glycosyltransferase involved in cell wall biosynthesis